MTTNKSHWTCGLIYINADDPRLLVPLPCKLGLAVNFGNPRSVATVFWIWLIWCMAFLFLPVMVHPSGFVHDPTPLLWVMLSLLGAFVIVRLNGCFGWCDYRYVRLASFGFAAIGVGFGIQTLINGSLVLIWGANNLHWPHHLVLAPVAAAAQTFGKIVALLLLLKAKPVQSLRQCVRYGLLVGLGFTASEIILFYFRWAWGYVPADHFEWAVLIGVWERVSASVFHVYGTALVALSIWFVRWWLIGFVVAVHALMDFLAFANLLGPVYALETIISACALTTWFAFLLIVHAMERGNLMGAQD